MKQPPLIRVSEHAVLRYLERVKGVNVDEVRAHIAAICSAPAAIGAKNVRAEGVRFVIAEGGECVKTVAPDGPWPEVLIRMRVVLSREQART